MKFLSDIPMAVIHAILSEIQRALWLDTDMDGDVWNADKQWSPETLEDIAGVLEHHGLRPDEPIQLDEAHSQAQRSEPSPVPDEVVISTKT